MPQQSKADLQDVLDQVSDILQEAYQPESDRETLAAAIGDALDAINSESEDDDVDEDDDTNGD